MVSECDKEKFIERRMYRFDETVGWAGFDIETYRDEEYAK